MHREVRNQVHGRSTGERLSRTPDLHRSENCYLYLGLDLNPKLARLVQH